jgi:LuxR family maltose regulon positive regulatory protein
VRDFLVQTSILERLSASLCDAVVSGSGSQQLLEEIERSNLFVVPLNNKRQ